MVHKNFLLTDLLKKCRLNTKNTEYYTLNLHFGVKFTNFYHKRKALVNN